MTLPAVGDCLQAILVFVVNTQYFTNVFLAAKSVELLFYFCPSQQVIMNFFRRFEQVFQYENLLALRSQPMELHNQSPASAAVALPRSRAILQVIKFMNLRVDIIL